MTFIKGQSGNPTGRTPGTTNKATQTVRDKFAQLLDGYDVQQLRDNLNAIENPKDRFAILLGLAEFVTPKLSRTALTADGGTGQVLVTEVRIVSGYHDANGNFVKSPPLATSEKETEWEIAEDNRMAAAALNR